MYDYIVAGAGSAGCLVANRLSEKHRVLLIEAGGPDDNQWVEIPLGMQRLVGDPNSVWPDRTEPAEEIAGRSIPLVQGRMMGGSSSVNGMMYVRGQREDYDGWAEVAGDDGWSWDEILPYFRKQTAYPDGDPTYFGTDGELKLSSLTTMHPTTGAYIEAAQEAGVPLNKNQNSGDQVGVAVVMGNIHHGRRQSSSVAFIDPIRDRETLDVLTNVVVSRVIIDDGVAVGVEVIEDGGATREIRATKEVVLCAGAIGSATILQLSGIGDAEHLDSLGIAVVSDLRGVGRNLQDHLFGHVKFKLRDENDSINATMRDEDQLAQSLAQWREHGTGTLSSTSSQSLIFFSADPAKTNPDVQLAMRPYSFGFSPEGVLGIDPFPGMMISSIAARPFSAGVTRIVSTDPTVRPLIDPGYLTDERDIDLLAAGIAKVRSIAAQPTLAPHIEAELEPGPDVTTPDEMADYLRRTVSTVYHPVGTCRMGTDDDAVVDAQLRVRGVRGLRVIDASIMPNITSGNTNAPTYLIAEKGAAMLLNESDDPPHPSRLGRIARHPRGKEDTMTINVGSITVTPVYEQSLDAVAVVVPDAQPAALRAIPWMAPPFIDTDGNPQGVVQAFVVRTSGTVILIDPCVGDDKDISVVAEWNHNTTGFLKRLADAGVQPEDVDIVVSTHLHLDHVGWATQLTPAGWKPTFTNARHLFMGVEFRHWENASTQEVAHPAADAPEIEHVLALFQETQINTFEQSVRPVQDAGLIDLIDEYGEIAPGVVLVPTPGHTPAHTSVSIRSGDDHLFLTGDAFHHPAQVAHPEWAALSDVDGEQSTATRRRLLAELVDTPTIVLGNHFAQPSMGRIVSDGSGGYIFDSTGLGA